MPWSHFCPPHNISQRPQQSVVQAWAPADLVQAHGSRVRYIPPPSAPSSAQMVGG